MDTRRHAPLGRARPRFAPTSSRSRPHAYVGRSGRPLSEIYASDHADSRRGGRFRWLLSTCLAAAVGVLAILVAITGSMDTRGTTGGPLASIASIGERLRETPLPLPLPAPPAEGLRWAIPKADKMLIPTGDAATRSYHTDPIKQRRGNREYTHHKYYVRLAARLGPVSKKQAQAVPPFNAYKLYSDAGPLDGGERQDGQQQQGLAARLIELNGILPIEDGQELDAEEVLAIVARAQAAEEEAGAAGGELLAGRAERLHDVQAPQTTALHKTVFDPEEPVDDGGAREVPPVKVQRGDTLGRVLARVGGAQAQQVRAMVEAMRSVLPENALLPGYEVRAVMLPSPVRPGGDLVRFSVFDDSGGHKVTVARNGTGDYAASADYPDEPAVRAALPDNDRVQDSSLYASFYYAAVRHGVPADLILQILRIHAYGTDFRQRVRVGDGVELFFDVKGEERGIEGELGELLATFVTAGGETHKFYRYRTPDGRIDFYDAEGSTARKFLMRRPVRGEDVRLTSGFGMRKHPLLNTVRMHSGVDWATAHGTPIMAAGNGIVEFAGPKGENGNLLRIRHANGYKTAYAHMSGFATGVVAGVRVRQGQTIGYVGSTGLSSGPHLHFEVMIKNRLDNDYANVDPRTIPVPNDRQLTGKDLADFKRERARIDDLMRRPAVRSTHLPS
jgi:murein DD-endopeptidase MepM/ murein hydrolase activator NlpD